ncbi:MAG: adenylosuccinate lyase [Candidatus Sumerlaeia bacterium]
MIERYTLPEMGRLWSEEAKFAAWLEVELLACEAWERLGKIPAGAAARIRAKAGFDTARIEEIERTVRHDVIAFLQNVEEHIGPDLAPFLHRGLTSSDIVDTALNLRLVRALDLILDKAQRLEALLLEQSARHKHTLMMGRTHGMHSEPTTFGLKCLLWAGETGRNIARLRAARSTIAVGKLSGAVGTFAHCPPEVEAFVCERLGLVPAPVSSQIIQRDRHAELMAALALTGATLEKIALEVRHLQRPEIGELSEPFGRGQKGSSAMPHKKNPVTCEQICGLARLLRANLQAALENVALWHERDISHSSVERVILPDSTTVLDYLLDRACWLVQGWVVNAERMRENMNLTRGAVFAAKVLVLLMDRGVPRTEAYELVQRHALRAFDERRDLRDLLSADPLVMRHFTADELARELTWESYLAHIDAVFARAGGKQENDGGA